MNVTPELDARFRAAAVARGARRRPLRRRRLAGRRAARRRDRPRPLPHLVRPARARRRSSRASSASACCASPLDDVRRELDEYFEGTRREFDLPLDLRVAPFHARGAARARARPVRARRRPTARSPRKVGRPRAARAVGTVMNRNPIPIVLPCHRVVGANGSLTGYAGGLDRKLTAARSSRARSSGR